MSSEPKWTPGSDASLSDEELERAFAVLADSDAGNHFSEADDLYTEAKRARESEARLLEELEALVAWFEKDGPYFSRGSAPKQVERARDAIKAAEGT